MFQPPRWVLFGLLLTSCSTLSGGGGTAATGGSGGRSDPADAAGSGGNGGTAPGSGGSVATTPDSAAGGDAASNPEVVPDQPAGDDQAGDTPNAPANDAKAPDGGGNGEVAATMCPAGTYVCDDFEKYAVGGDLGPTWTTDLMGGTVRVDTTRPFRGKQGVHISANVGVTNLLQIVAQGPTFPVAGNMFYGRMMLWLSQLPPDHTNFVQASGPLSGTTQIAKYAYGTKYGKLMAGYTIRNRESDPPFVDCGNKPAMTGYPEKQWLCVEWQFDGTKDEMHHWLNGQAQAEVDVIKTGGCSEGGAAPADGRWHAPVFNKVMLGFYAHPFNTPIDVWIDDVVISNQRVGCPAAP